MKNDVLNGLDYIAASPAQEHGGFHPETMRIAQNAVTEIRNLRDALRALLEMVDSLGAHGPCKNARCSSCRYVQDKARELLR